MGRRGPSSIWRVGTHALSSPFVSMETWGWGMNGGKEMQEKGGGGSRGSQEVLWEERARALSLGTGTREHCSLGNALPGLSRAQGPAFRSLALTTASVTLFLRSLTFCVGTRGFWFAS